MRTTDIGTKVKVWKAAYAKENFDHDGDCGRTNGLERAASRCAFWLQKASKGIFWPAVLWQAYLWRRVLWGVLALAIYVVGLAADPGLWGRVRLSTRLPLIAN
jgi:hypothetical protein